MAGTAMLASGALARATRAAAPSQVLFAQPSLDGIAANFSVTGVVPQYNPVGVFYLHANQPSQYTPDGHFDPVLWDAGRMTGYATPFSRATWQRGVLPHGPGSGSGHTTAQICGPVVGAYLNSADLFGGSPGHRMMISPNYQFANPVSAFAAAGSGLEVSLDLQVPIATDGHLVVGNLSNTYAKLDLLFICTKSNTRLSYSCGLFLNAPIPKRDGTGYDDLSFTVIIAAQVSSYGQLVTRLPGSAEQQGAPWLGWKSFAFTISRAQLAAGLAAAAPVARTYGYTLSRDPTDYVLAATHLNAELHYTAAHPATLGWSMRNLRISRI